MRPYKVTVSLAWSSSLWHGVRRHQPARALVGDTRAETVGMTTATIELLRALLPDVILDRSYVSRRENAAQTVGADPSA